MNVFISERKIGEASRWRSLSLSLALLLTLLLVDSPWDLLPEDSVKNTASVDKIWENIYSEDYISAKKLVQKELQSGKSDSLHLLSLLEICLNGLGRPKQADETRKKILQLWEKNYKRSFVEENYPLNLATWTRMAVVTPNILVLGSEYYIPYPINPKKDGFYYHKFTAYNRFTKRAIKFFKLEKSSNTENEYRLYEISSEGEAISIKNYGNALPDLREEMKDVTRHLKL
ncbi:hypothetical protein LEP1GSC050_3174 [Leptospira broomii serovar Hurstbridge str. 5399]|uniref:Uncharacterized protein n=1 Tax=Leptospira broomii serovar Hurstbridge str. 5399 TaxID=1049789 RepID=T0FER7_9LEPT|nr:hypothetical protein [Leptospira broomii]EQA46077.1 hypothetical protein LEP1GSC050_3174 [Leptospira broomii serovar Hurstbridge str. 5399]